MMRDVLLEVFENSQLMMMIPEKSHFICHIAKCAGHSPKKAGCRAGRVRGGREWLRPSMPRARPGPPTRGWLTAAGCGASCLGTSFHFHADFCPVRLPRRLHRTVDRGPDRQGPSSAQNRNMGPGPPSLGPGLAGTQSALK